MGDDWLVSLVLIYLSVITVLRWLDCWFCWVGFICGCFVGCFLCVFRLVVCGVGFDALLVVDYSCLLFGWLLIVILGCLVMVYCNG